VVRQRIGANYFATVGVPLSAGREFTQQDLARTTDAGQSALLNQTGAQELFGLENPIGRRIREVGTNKSYTIVWVARDLKAGFFASKPVATVFVPLFVDAQGSAAMDALAALNTGAMAAAPGATIVVRGPSGADAINAVRAEMATIDRRLTVFNTRTMREQIAQMNSLIQLSSTFYGGIGVFGLILASVGLAGVTAYAVARRSKENGIRMALGASRNQVLGLVMKEGATLVAVGTVVGFAGAVAISRALSSMTEEVARALGASTGDPLLLIGAPLLLAALAMLACYLPARKATEIDPLTALRQE
jgi:ABC-type antimicrobial peptide transport system permease subunit